MTQLPENIVNKIMLYLSHPVADIVRDNAIFKKLRYKTEYTHGCPYDRGRADAYYGKDIDPHYWTNGTGRNGGRVEKANMTYNEVEAYIYWVTLVVMKENLMMI